MSTNRIPLLLSLLAAACAGEPAEMAEMVPEALPTWTFDATMVFPADGSLVRPEDGVALPGGDLLVADQVHGLRRIRPDGSSEPFGEMVAAGYRHDPPALAGGANGVSLEPGGTHVLVADVFGAAIFRVDVTTGAAERLYQHTYGINTAVRDTRGMIWFTQSAHNRPEDGEARMWAAVAQPLVEGALYRLPMEGDRPAGPAELVVDSLVFANGIAVDDAAGRLYVSEVGAGRVWRFRLDPATGALDERELFADSTGADNIELDGEGNLWMAVPLGNALVVANTTTGNRHVAFQALSAEQGAAIAEFLRRGEAGEERMSLLGPDLWAPLPGLLTGVILSPAGGPVYLATLGNALVRLPRP